MINTRQELTEFLKEDLKYYSSINNKYRFIDFLTKDNKSILKKYIIILRKSEYWYNKGSNICRIIYLYYRRRKNIIGRKIGIEIWENTFDKGLCIFHPGTIVINGNARIGKNCKLHGDNCIGNDGKSEDAPVIGDNVTIGVGAKVIGNINIADEIKIGAGAIVVDSFLEKGITIVGVPAKKVNS